MTEKKEYPRIRSDWSLFLSTGEDHRKIGYVRDISLSGALLVFSEDYSLDHSKHRFSLKLMNEQLDPPELEIGGLKEWEKREENEIFLEMRLDELEKEQKRSFIQFLSRSDRLEIQVYLMESI